MLIEDALLAQLDRVTGYEPVGQGFESLTAHQQKPRKHVVYVAFTFWNNPLYNPLLFYRVQSLDNNLNDFYTIYGVE